MEGSGYRGRATAVVVAHDDPAIVEEVADALESAPDVFVQSTSLEHVGPHNVVVAGGAALGGVRAGIAPVIALAGGSPLRDARAALAVGATEILAWPDERERIVPAVRRALVSRAPLITASTVVSVRGARGGLGASTLAALIATTCSGLVLDLHGGLRTLGEEGGDLIVPADPQPEQILAAARRLGEASIVTCDAPPGPPAARGLLAAAKRAAAAVVVDGGRDPADSVDMDVLLVGRDVASLRAARALANEDTVVVWRRTGAGASRREVEAVLERPVAAVLPDEPALARVVDLGRLPTSGRALKVARSLAGRAGLLP